MNFDGQSKGTVREVRRNETSGFMNTVKDSYLDVWACGKKKRSKGIPL